MRIALYVHLDGNTVTQFRTSPATEFGNITAFHLLSEQDQERHGWHLVQAVLPDFDPFKQKAGDIQVTYDPNKGFSVVRPIIDLTEQEVAAIVDTYNAGQRQARNAAMVIEADPIFMKFQRGESTRGQWLIKVEEIRQRYPYR